jgi:hypothetical protein
MLHSGRQRLPASALRIGALHRLGIILLACMAIWGLILWSIGTWSL